jgi:hypothetical protein
LAACFEPARPDVRSFGRSMNASIEVSAEPAA